MPAVNLRDERALHRALDAAAEELDLPLTSRQVRALARAAARLLAAGGAGGAGRGAVPAGFRQPTTVAKLSASPAPSRPTARPQAAPGGSRVPFPAEGAPGAPTGRTAVPHAALPTNQPNGDRS